jgi:hypothetical protein
MQSFPPQRKIEKISRYLPKLLDLLIIVRSIFVGQKKKFFAEEKNQSTIESYYKTTLFHFDLLKFNAQRSSQSDIYLPIEFNLALLCK